MSKPITARIDLSKVAKQHIFQGKNGAKYLNVAIFPNRDGVSQYGDSHFIAQDIPKEARDAGERGAIIGNLKMPDADDQPRRQQQSSSRRPDSGFSRPQREAPPKNDDDEFNW